MASSPTIYATLSAQVEKLEDRWRATQDELGLFAYGETADEASKRLITAVDFFLDLMLKHGGAEAVEARLNSAGIDFTITEKPDAENTPRTMPFTLSVAKALNSA